MGVGLGLGLGLGLGTGLGFDPDPTPHQEPDKKASFIGALKLPWAKETSTERARLSAHHEQARRG